MTPSPATPSNPFANLLSSEKHFGLPGVVEALSELLPNTQFTWSNHFRDPSAQEQEAPARVTVKEWAEAIIRNVAYKKPLPRVAKSIQLERETAATALCRLRPLVSNKSLKAFIREFPGKTALAFLKEAWNDEEAQQVFARLQSPDAAELQVRQAGVTGVRPGHHQRQDESAKVKIVD